MFLIGGKKVAVKIQKVFPDVLEDIQEEYRILRDLSDHPNLPDFYGAYLKRGRGGDEVWFVMQVRKTLKHHPNPKWEYLKLLVAVLKAVWKVTSNCLLWRIGWAPARWG